MRRGLNLPSLRGDPHRAISQRQQREMRRLTSCLQTLASGHGLCFACNLDRCTSCRAAAEQILKFGLAPAGGAVPFILRRRVCPRFCVCLRCVSFCQPYVWDYYQIGACHCSRRWAELGKSETSQSGREAPHQRDEPGKTPKKNMKKLHKTQNKLLLVSRSPATPPAPAWPIYTFL